MAISIIGIILSSYAAITANSINKRLVELESVISYSLNAKIVSGPVIRNACKKDGDGGVVIKTEIEIVNRGKPPFSVSQVNSSLDGRKFFDKNVPGLIHSEKNLTLEDGSVLKLPFKIEQGEVKRFFKNIMLPLSKKTCSIVEKDVRYLKSSILLEILTIDELYGPKKDITAEYTSPHFIIVKLAGEGFVQERDVKRIKVFSVDF